MGKRLEMLDWGTKAVGKLYETWAAPQGGEPHTETPEPQARTRVPGRKTTNLGSYYAFL